MSVGAGFDVRNPQDHDVDDEVDIDGDDQVAFGAAQFTERDIIPIGGTAEEDEDVRIDSDGENHQQVGTSLRELVAQGKVVLQSQTDANGMPCKAVVRTVRFNHTERAASHTYNRTHPSWAASCVESALTPTPNRQFLQDAGTHVARNVGCAVWVQRNYARYVNASLAHWNLDEYIYEVL